MIVAMVATIAAIVMAYINGNIIPITEQKGLALPSACSWIASGAVSTTINILLVLAAASMMILLNKLHNIIRSISTLFATIFIVMQAATPGLAGQLYDGTVLCLTILFATFILFSTFGRYNETRSIFLIFFLLALGALTQYAYALFIPAFILGCIQMRTLTFRGLLAAGIGLISPLWILWGLGIIRLDEINLPSFTSVASALSFNDTMRLTSTIGFTILVTLVTGVANFMKVYGYNARTRAFNGFFGILTIFTIILLFVDFTNIAVYIPLLNCCAAMQIGHFFVINHHVRTYIPILSLILIYAAFCVWTFLG